MNPREKLTAPQIAVLKQADQAKGDGWMYSAPTNGPLVAGLVRRGLLRSRRDHNRELRIAISSEGIAALVRYGESPRPRPPKQPKPTDLASYCVHTGADGKIGIYTRDYNVRLATFNANTYHLQAHLLALFDQHLANKDNEEE